jgi:hypothetical protein
MKHLLVLALVFSGFASSAMASDGASGKVELTRSDSEASFIALTTLAEVATWVERCRKAQLAGTQAYLVFMRGDHVPPGQLAPTEHEYLAVLVFRDGEGKFSTPFVHERITDSKFSCWDDVEYLTPAELAAEEEDRSLSRVLATLSKKTLVDSMQHLTSKEVGMFKKLKLQETYKEFEDKTSEEYLLVSYVGDLFSELADDDYNMTILGRCFAYKTNPLRKSHTVASPPRTSTRAGAGLKHSPTK